MSDLDRQKVQEPHVERPHILLLGAGASYAAFPNGDKNGRKLPLMYNIVDVLGLRPILQKAGISYGGENFESLYSSLVQSGNHQLCVDELEAAIFDYFGGMELPEEPTLFDHLVLSLRPKDYIATFNWDPFLVQATARNYPDGGGPTLSFLHGNTAVGYCMAHEKPSIGRRGNKCSQCGKLLSNSRLLYPVAQKHYDNDPLIKMFWDSLREQLNHAFVFTIFGYGAPASDAEAVQLMSQAWGKVEERQFEETEIIDIKSEEELIQTWKPFIHTHHYQTSKSFYNSILARHPRRSCDAMWAQLMDAEFIDENKIHIDPDWIGLRGFIKPLLEDEEQWALKNKLP